MQVPVKVVVATDLIIRGVHLIAFKQLQQKAKGRRKRGTLLLPKYVSYTALSVSGLFAFTFAFKFFRRR